MFSTPFEEAPNSFEMYEFNKLSTPRSKAFLSHLAAKKDIQNPMKLLEFYYLEQRQLNRNNGIGF